MSFRLGLRTSLVGARADLVAINGFISSRFSRRLLSTAPSSNTIVLAPTWGIPTHPGDTLGTVEELLVPVGSKVLAGETMAVVETDKLAAEVKAPHDGIVRAVLVELGAEVDQKQPIFELSTLLAEVGADGTSEDRRWAHELQERKAAEAMEAERHWRAWQEQRWQAWQRRWSQEQRRRWEHWRRRPWEEPWWRGQRAHWHHGPEQERQRQAQQQRQQQQQQQHQQQQQGWRRASPVWPSKATAISRLPAGDVKRTLLATTHYEALGVSRSCSTRDVKAAYRQLAHRLHPDTWRLYVSVEAQASSGLHGEQNGAECSAIEEEEAAAREAFLRLQVAHTTLSSSRRRRDYDRSLRW